MASSYTPNCKLAKPATNDVGWGTPVNANSDLSDAMTAFGGLCVSPHETVSVTLGVDVSPGVYVKADGTLAVYAGTGGTPFALTLSSNNYLWLTDAGVLTSGTAWPAAGINHVRLAFCVAGATSVTSVADARVQLASAGSSRSLLFLSLAAADAAGVVVVNTGATNGVRFGGASTDKLAFFGGTPIILPAGANQAAVTDGSGGTASFAIATISDSATANAVASLARQLEAVRSALVALKLLKGGA